jgi:Ca-activated chloride channel family protein
MKRLTIGIAILVIAGSAGLRAGGSEESAAGSGARASYLADQGIIVPPEEVHINSYIASVDYRYPAPTGPVGVTLYNGTRLLSSRGQEGVLHIGLQGSRVAFADLSPLNLAFVIDVSSSMDDNDKIEWIKEGMDIFLERVRENDFVSVVTFNTEARVIFPSTRMRDEDSRDRLRAAVQAIQTGGGSDLQAGLEQGYEQIMVNYRGDYTNRVLFLSDGTEMASRLARAGAKSGDVRFSLMWNNRNDLDLHVVDPSRAHIFYSHRRSYTGGELDVDMNVNGETLKPVENIYWPRDGAPEGRYRVWVNMFRHHEARSETTPFVVEIQNRSEITTFEGEFPAHSRGRDIDVAEISFQGSAGRKRELSNLEEIARGYRELGVNVSTIGVGMAFDLELMTKLSKAGGGSSRFIADREEMERIFGSEFDRMVVPAARNLDMVLEFMPGVEVLDTWGYNHSITGSRVTYSQATLHNRDYETILVRYRMAAQRKTGPAELARFTVDYEDLEGRPHTVGPVVARVQLVEDANPLAGYSNGMVLHSGTMLAFAESMRTIGQLYYQDQEHRMALAAGLAQIDGEAVGRLTRARQITGQTKRELANAALRLDVDTFDDEIAIMDSYIEALSKALESAEEWDPERDDPLVGERGERIDAPERTKNDRPLAQHLDHLFKEMALDLEDRQGAVAVSGFTTKKGDSSGLIELLDEMAATQMSEMEDLTLVERARLDMVLREQELGLSDLMDTSKAIGVGRMVAANYIVTGSVVETTRTVMIFGRVINVSTGEVESAAQVIVPRDQEVSGLLI